MIEITKIFLNFFIKNKALLFILFVANIHNMFCAYLTFEERVIICGTGKNIAPCLPNMRKKIELLGNFFKDYRVIIYENNSTDGTQALLNKWARENPKVTVITEKLTADQLYNRTKAHALKDQAPNRMELIAYGRNQVLQEAFKPELDNYNFLIMTDLDFKKGWTIEGVLSCFDIDEEWDGLTANGVAGGIYYDRYAYRDEMLPLGPELLGEIFWQQLEKHKIKFDVGSKIKKVYSAFGGIAVYRKVAIKNCVYWGYETADFRQFMGTIVNKMSFNNAQYKAYQDVIGIRGHPLPIRFQANCGYDGPVVCEHSTFHASMALRGFDKIFINPDMICTY